MPRTLADDVMIMMCEDDVHDEIEHGEIGHGHTEINMSGMLERGVTENDVVENDEEVNHVEIELDEIVLALGMVAQNETIYAGLKLLAAPSPAIL